MAILLVYLDHAFYQVRAKNDYLLIEFDDCIFIDKNNSSITRHCFSPMEGFVSYYFFHLGPRAQVSKMFHPTRKNATLLYLASLSLTLLVALVKNFTGQDILLFMLLSLQYISVTWYCLSYIPFARQLAARLFGRLVAYEVSD